jgi:hypothetical protein
MFKIGYSVRDDKCDKRATFLAAEKLARGRCKRDGRWQYISCPAGFLVAQVCQDALGRVWTDMTWYGVRFLEEVI